MCKLGSNTGLFSAVFFSCFNLSRLKILCSTTGVSRNKVRFSPSVPEPVSTRRNPRRLVRDKHFGFLQSLKMLGGHLWRHQKVVFHFWYKQTKPYIRYRYFIYAVHYIQYIFQFVYSLIILRRHKIIYYAVRRLFGNSFLNRTWVILF